jgi:uncharacterized protein (DUF1501 family)
MTAPSRRSLLTGGLGLGAVFLGAPAFAAAAGQRKLVVIVLRGALDGLSLAPPVGDPDYARLRGPIAIPPDRALAIDGYFALHPKLLALHEMVSGGQARIAPAVALPQRIRSHFEAQDLLESGGARLYEVSTGWLNRAVAAAGGAVVAISIGPQEPLILRGPRAVRSWSPGGRGGPDQSRLAAALQDLYHGDPLLEPALATGLRTEGEAEALALGAGSRADAKGFAVAAARFLTDPGGPSVAVLSLDGFDTHAAQGAAEGQLAQRLAGLDGVFEGLREGLGPDFDRTVILAVTEFGRTARVNGTRGTDHGTASALVLAGGAVRPGGIVGDWPTLAEGRLFENRDLAPTLDVRSVFKGVLRDHLGVGAAALEAVVFPESGTAAPCEGLIRA